MRRILEHYFLPSGKDIPPLLLPPKTCPQIVMHLENVVCRRQLPMFALFSSLCDSIWVEVLRQGSAIVGNAQCWPSIRKQLVGVISFNLFQVLQDPALKTYFIKYLGLPSTGSGSGSGSGSSLHIQQATCTNKDVMCLQCFDVISMLLTSVDDLKHPTCRLRATDVKKMIEHTSETSVIRDKALTGDQNTINSGTGGFTDPIQAFGVLLLDARTLYAQFFADKRTNAMVSGVTDSTKFELSSLLAATASVQGSTGSSKLDDDALYSLDFSFALNHALLFECCFKNIEMECLTRLRLRYTQFQSSTEYALMMAFVRSQHSVEVFIVFSVID